jgi:hypothetical protein
MGLFMLPKGRVTSLTFTRSLVTWADRFAHLPGFVYLDSGTTTNGSELELITALPTKTFSAQDYSNNLTSWMTDIEQSLAVSYGTGPALGTAELFNGGLVVGNLDYDTPAGRLRRVRARNGLKLLPGSITGYWCRIPKPALLKCCITRTVLSGPGNRSSQYSITTPTRPENRFDFANPLQRALPNMSTDEP